MTSFRPGDDVWINFDDGTFPAEVLKVEKSGFIICRAHLDLSWDFGRASARLDPEQTVAVRPSHVRPRDPDE